MNARELNIWDAAFTSYMAVGAWTIATRNNPNDASSDAALANAAATAADVVVRQFRRLQSERGPT